MMIRSLKQPERPERRRLKLRHGDGSRLQFRPNRRCRFEESGRPVPCAMYLVSQPLLIRAGNGI